MRRERKKRRGRGGASAHKAQVIVVGVSGVEEPRVETSGGEVKSGLVEKQDVPVSLKVNEGMVEVSVNVTQACALMKVFHGVLGIRQEAEDARRVLAKPADHGPPVQPCSHNGGRDPGSRLPGLSASRFAESVESGWREHGGTNE